MGVNPGRHGDESPIIWSGECKFPQILSCFKIVSTRWLALQCSESLSTPWLWQRIHYFPKVHLQRLLNHHFRQKFNIFLARSRTKIPLSQNWPKHAISSEKKLLFFCGSDLATSPDHFPHPIPRPLTKPSSSAPARFTPLEGHWQTPKANEKGSNL